jgi:hypothetical protein
LELSALALERRTTTRSELTFNVLVKAELEAEAAILGALNRVALTTPPVPPTVLEFEHLAEADLRVL